MMFFKEMFSIACLQLVKMGNSNPMTGSPVSDQLYLPETQF
jgi:hypothetical protein